MPVHFYAFDLSHFFGSMTVRFVVLRFFLVAIFSPFFYIAKQLRSGRTFSKRGEARSLKQKTGLAVPVGWIFMTRTGASEIKPIARQRGTPGRRTAQGIPALRIADKLDLAAGNGAVA